MKQHDRDSEEVSDKDVALLATLGYKQDFKRTFSRLELFGVGFSIIGVFPSVAGVLIFAIPYGGPVAMVWGWAVCSVFIMCIAATIAELGSAAPTAGGLYYWTYKYASPRTRNLLSWIVGYMSTITYAVATTAVAWACAVSILAGASIGSDFAYVPTTGQTFGVFTAVILFQLMMATLPSPIVAQLQKLYIALNILVCLGVIVALPIVTPKENINSAKYVFAAFDAPTHISEEASNASYAVPFATLTSPAVAVVLGLALNIALAFCMGTDLESIVGNEIGQPLATILFNSFGKKGTLAVWSFTIMVQVFMGAGALTAGARLTWAFSRDGALPFSSYISRLNPVTGTPTYAALLTAFVAFTVGTLVFAGPAASTALFSASLVMIYVDLIVVVLCRFLGGERWEPGLFSLGRWSKPIAFTSTLFMTLVVVILSFPSNPSPTAATMNYTCLMIGGYVLLVVAYYYVPVYGAKTWFRGPRSNLRELGVGASGGEERSLDEKAGVYVKVL
ncbi:hypothetical protein EUX98_g8805 [Antrodiella citrinella]|uniref:Amino acid permease/ SLC12A domain-containing protein n=1 Tax=Antrodiella citrinella TaxID=2447956 RepID=A0A4S4M2K4_9APHY|nr:hypothetical protein EUX98_g8805 [Antrodiella citrinella]